MANSETHDGTGAGDHDQPFSWGTPPSCRLTHWQIAGLLLMRGQIKDFKQGKLGGAADGDIETRETS